MLSYNVAMASGSVIVGMAVGKEILSQVGRYLPAHIMYRKLVEKRFTNKGWTVCDGWVSSGDGCQLREIGDGALWSRSVTSGPNISRPPSAITATLYHLAMASGPMIV
jgi:hypothetical protein